MLIARIPTSLLKPDDIGFQLFNLIAQQLHSNLVRLGIIPDILREHP